MLDLIGTLLLGIVLGAILGVLGLKVWELFMHFRK
jgi:hypothetical protein